MNKILSFYSERLQLKMENKIKKNIVRDRERFFMEVQVKESDSLLGTS